MKPILLHSSDKHNLPSNLPANFYGMSDNHVYILYKGTTKAGDKERVSCVILKMENFHYDYEKSKLYQISNNEKKLVLSADILPDITEGITEIAVFDTCSSVLIAELKMEAMIRDKIV